ncbi:DUF1816 domain-containing protein [Leptolyngbya sp. AN02str]|uniref:DUF1816 domain-containing protein n=1 Tax=Leptolyngbya sp. AN02str TaxID=3423363 RepID=UPI003D31E098
MKELLTNFLNSIGFAWWVEVVTDAPRCTYYFGPFLNSAEAEYAKPGYIEDLEREGAQNIRVVVKRCKPGELTLYDEKLDVIGRGASLASPFA